jgi:hypothetical protein
MGRPTKLNPEVIAKMAESVRGGNYPEVAAVAAGITATTYHNWMKRGRDLAERLSKSGDGPETLSESERPYLEFVESINAASAECETNLVAVIVEAAERGEKGALEFLSRRFPRRWAKRQAPPASFDDDDSTPIINVTIGVIDGIDPADIPPDGAEV